MRRAPDFEWTFSTRVRERRWPAAQFPASGCQRDGATSIMLTFHGSQELKDQRIAQVRAHRLADQLVKGQYWQDGKGCAVGCTIHSGNHEAYETELGIPVELAHLEDRIFENLDNGSSMMWPERFLLAIPVGVDLRGTHINKRFVLALLTDEKRGMVPRIKDDKTKKRAAELVEFLRQGIAEPSPTAALDALRDLADLADLAYRAYLADLAYLAYRAYLAYLADRADLAYLADRADLAYRAYRADLAEILLEVLAASAPSTSSLPTPSRRRRPGGA